MSAPSLTLISHHLCPYVQRVAIVLAEKGIPFERYYVELTAKPDWFLACAQLSKAPALLVEQQHIYESGTICEYLDPHDTLKRGQYRVWIEFGTSILNAIGNFYTAPDEMQLRAKANELARKFVQVEAALRDGPFFAGGQFCMVDAAFGPIFRCFDVFDQIDNFGVFDLTPKVRAWRAQLAQRSSVKNAVQADYPVRFRQFLLARDSELSRRLEAQVYSLAA